VSEARTSGHLVTWHRARRHRTALAGAVVFSAILLFAVTANQIAPANPLRQNIEARLHRPGWVDPAGHKAWLGTDALGRDVLSRLIYGSRVSLVISLASVAFAGLLGFGAGLASGYYGGVVDTVLMRIADLQLAFPFILLALAIIALLGPTLVNIMIVFAVTSWPVYARIVRGSVLALRSQEFVLAARSLGRGHLGILLHHITPNALAPLIVIASFEVARMIIAESALGFLGLGVQPPTPTWGNMVADGRLYIRDAWWLAAFPGMAIMLIATAINLIGDGLRDLLDPRLRSE
jgi:peptide/nickel transport system permease protein